MIKIINRRPAYPDVENRTVGDMITGGALDRASAAP